MELINVLTTYIIQKATAEEIARIEEALKVRRGPVLEPNIIRERLITKAKNMWLDNPNSKLQIVKYVKDVTGWGLKEAKDWCEDTIFPSYSQQDEEEED